MLQKSLSQLREGMFGRENKGRADLTVTDEGFALSVSLLRKGYLDESDLAAFPAIKEKKKGIHPVIECTQNIPCNPCQEACPKGCILVGDKITGLPVISGGSVCTGCGMCVAACSGQAVFLVDEDFEDGYAAVTLPYEFLPIPRKGDRGTALDRSGQAVCEAEVVNVRTGRVFDATTVLTMKVPADMSMRARFFQRGGILK